MTIAELKSKKRGDSPALSSNTTPTGKAPAKHTIRDADAINAAMMECPLQLRSPKLDFPVFAGNDLSDWLCKARQYFELDMTPDEWKVKVAAMYLEGRALKWYHAFMQNWEGNQVVT